MSNFEHVAAASIGAGTPRPGPRRDNIPFVARTLLRILQRLDSGHLGLTLPNGEHRAFTGAHPGAAAELHIHDWKAIGILLRKGDIGLAECWRDGRLTTPDMTAFLALCAANQGALERVFYGHPVVAAFFRLLHRLRPNTRAGSRRNIHAHYDLGNGFYRLWLDPSMSYSAARFEAGKAQTLEQAQAAKYDRVIRELDLQPGHRVLEIGCGWGGFAEHAAKTAGCHVTGLTISKAQLDFATERMRRAGLEERVDLRFCDYRDARGQYDRVVSIEMVEAVGERYWPAFFRTVHDRLAPGGRALVQSIVIAEDAFERYRATSDFIREYIFPGGMLPTVARFASGARSAGLIPGEAFRFGADYARTLRHWERAFDEAEPAVRALGFDDGFLALWRFYFHYCKAGFDTGRIDVMQVGLRRP